MALSEQQLAVIKQWANDNPRGHWHSREAMVIEILRLVGECERLRKALKKIANGNHIVTINCPACIAREALEGEE